jgi:NADH-quinone oxidoreductase subunit N
MSMSQFLEDMNTILPLVVLVVWACVLLLVDLAIPKGRKGWTALLAGLGLVVSAALTLWKAGSAGGSGAAKVGSDTAFNGMITVDGFAVYLSVLILVSGIGGITLAYDYLKRTGLERGEYYVLLLFSISGMVLMTQAADLIMVFLALELLSIPLYVLAGFAVPKLNSEEASLKYFLLGSFATGFVLYGVSLTFGATGQTSLAGIVEAVTASAASTVGLLIGAAMILVGLGFKVAVVPFHMWTPDVYQGAPTSVTGFMAVGAKVAGFAALLRVFFLAYPSLAPSIAPVIAVLAAVTMILGNVIAIAQTNIKRLLAYSSIANAGYILMALVPIGQAELAAKAVASALFYLFTYAITSFCAWAVVIAVEQNESAEISDYAGLGRRQPLLAAAMTVAMLSFTGIPPTLGFFGKFFLFGTVIEGGYVWLALVGVLTSLVSAYYYLRVVVIMYMREGADISAAPAEIHHEGWLTLTALVTGLGTLALGLLAAPLFEWASKAVLGAF